MDQILITYYSNLYLLKCKFGPLSLLLFSSLVLEFLFFSFFWSLAHFSHNFFQFSSNWTFLQFCHPSIFLVLGFVYLIRYILFSLFLSVLPLIAHFLFFLLYFLIDFCLVAQKTKTKKIMKNNNLWNNKDGKNIEVRLKEWFF